MPAETGCLFSDWPLDNQPAPARSGSVAEELRDARPRFQPIDRRQLFLRTVDVEAFIEEDHAARGD